ncbi:diphthamide biosynthesis protein 3 [Quercus suber]|uniref:Diphthamide biosynthesis protein 3 n=1 Tax=Quercus suber TaxID=58331 RepID=A0AAW0KS07_QUESU
MSYDDVEIEDMEWNSELQAYTYPCLCRDLFKITKDELKLAKRFPGALAAFSTSPSSRTSMTFSPIPKPTTTPLTPYCRCLIIF